MLHTQNIGDIGRYIPGTRTGSFTTLEDFTFFFSFFFHAYLLKQIHALYPSTVSFHCLSFLSYEIRKHT